VISEGAIPAESPGRGRRINMLELLIAASIDRMARLYIATFRGYLGCAKSMTKLSVARVACCSWGR